MSCVVLRGRLRGSRYFNRLVVPALNRKTRPSDICFISPYGGIPLPIACAPDHPISDYWGRSTEYRVDLSECLTADIQHEGTWWRAYPRAVHHATARVTGLAKYSTRRFFHSNSYCTSLNALLQYPAYSDTASDLPSRGLFSYE